MSRKVRLLQWLIVAASVAASVSAQGAVDSRSVLAQFRYLPAGSNAVAQSLATANQGNSFIAGVATPPDRADSQVFLAKISATGNILFLATFGGSAGDTPSAVLIGSNGKAVVVGNTRSRDFPVTSDAFQSALAGDQDGFIVRLSEQGSIEYSTYLGGSAFEAIGGAAMDVQGNIYVAGQTSSSDLPVTPSAMQSTRSGPVDAFVARIDAASGRLAYATYLGGPGEDVATAVGIDGAGNLYVGGAAADGFRATAGAYSVAHGASAIEAFVAKFDSVGGLLYSTYLGDGPTSVAALSVDPAGRVAVTGLTSTRLITAANAPQPDPGGDFDSYVAILNAPGTAIDFATYLGGSRADLANTIGIGPDGMIAVGGTTSSRNFPVTKGAPQTLWIGGPSTIFSNSDYDGFVTVYDAAGKIRLSSFLGGTGTDGVNGIAWTSDGALVLVGATNAADFPSLPGTVVPEGSGLKAFWARFATPSVESVRVVEYYNPDLDHFFLTADSVEQQFVDQGAVGQWLRTGHVFGAAGDHAVCRFYGNSAINPATGQMYGPNSHFYTADPSECEYLKSLFDPHAKSWKFESNDFAASSSSGACPADRTPVWRAYNNGFAQGLDSNHRIVANKGAYDAMIAKGWIGEGVAMCASAP